jgi:regulator of sigma E protease
MIGIFIMAAQLIAGISILVILHELGHFWAARAFGIKVEKFYLFFDAWGKKLVSFNYRGTEYGIGWLPLGGYVKIAGMIDESMDTDQLEKPAKPWEFRSKPAWQRLIVMVGGVVMNIIAAILIFAMLKYAYGDESLINSSIKHGILPNEQAEEMGFRKGDQIVALNGKPVYYFQDALDANVILGDQIPVYTVKRNGVDTTITLPKDFLNTLSSRSKSLFFLPRMEVYIKKVIPASPAEKAGLMADDHIIAVDSERIGPFDEFQPILRKRAGKDAVLTIVRGADTMQLNAKVASDSTIGFQPYDKSWTSDIKEYSFFGSFPAGLADAYDKLAMQFTNWGKIFKGEVAVTNAVQGPIGIAKIYGPVWETFNFWFWTGLISLGLAFMNILPIPALDGGHVVLLILEMIKGKPLSNKAMERIQMAGMVIVLSLIVFILANDIGLFRIFNK